MKVTVDANILFAALVADGGTRRIWFNPEIELYAPEFILTEFLKYQKTIETKTSDKKALNVLLERVIKQIKLIPSNELKPYLSASESLIQDPKDWLYLACALKENTIIWSHDNEIINQKRIIVKSTKEMMEEFGEL